MNNLLAHYGFIAFIVFFAAIWLVVTTLLGVMSGWFSLMSRYPNRSEAALLTLNNRSGTMGLGVHFNGILKLGVCPSGLRIGVWRIFGLFCRDFFVPWSELRVTRLNRVLWQTAALQFGPGVGKLKLPAYTADKLARAALGRWPEPGNFPRESVVQIFRRIFLQWAVLTGFASLFFLLASQSAGPSANFPWWLAISFPAVTYGLVSLIRFFVALAQR